MLNFFIAGPDEQRPVGYGHAQPNLTDGYILPKLLPSYKPE
jgi:hypothetical protein